MLITETTNVDGDCLSQFAREIIDVHTGAAVDVGRIFIGEENDLHAVFLNGSRRKRTLFYLPARSRSTGTCALCRTSLIVLPKSRSPNKRCPCAVIAIKSHCRSSAAFKIPCAGSPRARKVSTVKPRARN